MKSFREFVLGLFIAVAGLAGLAYAAGVNYPGFLSIAGVQVDLSTDTPVLAITGGSTGQLGGGNTGLYVNTATTAAGTLTFPAAAPNGRVCDFNDETNVATAIVRQTSATDGKTVVTVAGTVTAGDKISWSCMAF